MVDREKVAQVRALTGAGSASDAVDLALDRFIAHAQLRHDVAAYLRQPMSADEDAVAGIPVRLDLDDDDVDYDAIYDATT